MHFAYVWCYCGNRGMTTPRHLVALACNRQLSRGGDFGAVMWYGLWPASSLLLLFGLVCYRGKPCSRALCSGPLGVVLWHGVAHLVWYYDMVAHLVWYYMTWCARLVAVKSTSSAAASPTVTRAPHILQCQIPLTNNRPNSNHTRTNS